MSFSTILNAPTGGGVALGATLTSGTQAAVMVSEAGTQPPPAPYGVVVKVSLNITAGATAGAYAVKLFQGNGLSGTQVGPAAGYTFQTIASSPSQVYLTFVDTSGYAGGQYTVGVTAAGSNGVFNFGSVEVMVPMQGTES
jgi:hypothetical protein